MSKSIVGALIVLAVLAGVWLSIDPSPYTGDREELSPEFANFLQADFKSAGKITLSKGKGTVELEKKDGQWVVASSYGYPADAEKIEKILTSLRELRGGDEIGTAAASHERFEVGEKKGAVIRVSDADGKPLGSVVVGKNAPGGGIGTTRIFMRFGDDESTYKVETNLRSDASLWSDDVEGKNYLEKDIVKLPEEMEVQTVRVTRPDKDDLIVERRFREVPVESSDDEKKEGEDEEKKEPETKREEYYVVTTGTETFEVGSSEEWSARGLLNRGKTITIDDAAEPKELAEYGLASPQMVVSLEYRKKDDSNDPLKSLTLSFGNAKKDEEGKDDGYYLMVGDDAHGGQIFTIATYKFDGWNKEAKDFLPKEEKEEEDKAEEDTGEHKEDAGEEKEDTGEDKEDTGEASTGEDKDEDTGASSEAGREVEAEKAPEGPAPEEPDGTSGEAPAEKK